MPQPGRAYIGTSGWSYAGWRDGFYAGVPRRRWLAYCAERFSALEVNATFYGAQRRTTFERWYDETPPAFRFAVKGNRFITHTRQLLVPDSSLSRERERAGGLKEKLAAVLWQLPQGLHRDLPRLQRFVGALQRDWPEPRHVIEFRHASWFEEETAQTLRQARIAVCLSDSADWPLWDRLTTDLAYVRLHGHERTYASNYGEAALRYWAERCGGWQADGCEVQLYFDNDAEGTAPRNAVRLRELLGV